MRPLLPSSARRLRLGVGLALALALAVLGGGCAGHGTAEPTGEVDWGIGGRADGFGCDPAGALCWTGADGEAMRRYLGAQSDLLMGEGDPWASSVGMVEALESLWHKMEPEEIAALAPLRDQAEAMAVDAPPEERLALAASAHAMVGERLASGYLTAHAVPLGQRTAPEGYGDRADGWDEPPADYPETGVTEGMQESLDLLRESGPLGQVYAFLLEHTGVLDDAPVPVDEDYPWSEPREEQVDRIVRRACWATAGWSTVAAAESLIPYAGIVISVSHEALMQFRLRARMIFQIAAVYGLDIREDLNLLLAATALMTSYHLPDIQALWASSMALPVLAAAVERLGGAVTVRTLVRALLLRALASVLASVSARGAEIVGRLAARAAARGTGRSILGYATFGLALVGDVALNTASTAAIGEHAHHLIRPWGAGMLVEGATMMTEVEARDCAALLLGQAMWADGDVTDEELRLLAAHLARDSYDGERFAPMNDAEQTRAQARLAASVGGRSSSEVARHAEACVDDSFVGIEDTDRLALLSWVLTMAAIDGRLDPREEAVYDGLAVQLDGSNWFGDGDELEEPHLAAVEERILSLFLVEGRDQSLAEVPSVSLVERIDDLAPVAAGQVAAAFGR